LVLSAALALDHLDSNSLVHSASKSTWKEWRFWTSEAWSKMWRQCCGLC